MRALSFGALVSLATLVAGSCVWAQIAVTARPYQSLSVEIQSLRDDITLYQGDPQQLLQMDVHPNRFRPRIEYMDQSDATLRVRDLYVFDHPDFNDKTAEERDKSGDTPVAETWEMRISPTAPTEFSIRCERGESAFDFTHMEVRRVSLRAEGTTLEVEFADQNPIELERFAGRVIGGSFLFKHMMNARAKEISLDVPNAECRLDLTGKEFEGESAVNILSVPASVQLRVSRKLGVRVTGPEATIAGFQAPHMSRDGADWVSQGHAEAKGRIHITFGSEVPKLTVKWD